MSQHDNAEAQNIPIARNPPSPPSSGRKGRLTNQLDYLLNEVAIPLWKQLEARPFHKQVDAVRLKLPDYYVIIKQPMDLGTIRKRLENTYYQSASECLNDFELMFRNCYAYNKPEQDIVQVAKNLERKYQQLLGNMPAEEQDGAYERTRKRNSNLDIPPAKTCKTLEVVDQKKWLNVPQPESRTSTTVVVTKQKPSETQTSRGVPTHDTSQEQGAAGLKINKSQMERSKNPKPGPSRKAFSCNTPQMDNSNLDNLMQISSATKKLLSDYDSEDEKIYQEIFTLDKKRQLALEVHALPEKQATGVWQIIERNEPTFRIKDEIDDIDVDFEHLKFSTLADIELYLEPLRKDKTAKPCRKAATKKGKTSMPAGVSAVAAFEPAKQGGSWKTRNINDTSSGSTELDSTSDSSDSSDVTKQNCGKSELEKRRQGNEEQKKLSDVARTRRPSTGIKEISVKEEQMKSSDGARTLRPNSVVKEIPGPTKFQDDTPMAVARAPATKRDQSRTTSRSETSSSSSESNCTSDSTSTSDSYDLSDND